MVCSFFPSFLPLVDQGVLIPTVVAEVEVVTLTMIAHLHPDRVQRSRRVGLTFLNHSLLSILLITCLTSLTMRWVERKGLVCVCVCVCDRDQSILFKGIL